MLAVFNAQVLVDKPAQADVVRCAEVVVSLVVKVDVSLYAKMIALWAVRDSVPMGAQVVAKVAVLALAVETVGMDAVAAAMVQLVYSNGE